MTPNGYGPRSLPALEGLDVGLLGGGSGAPLVTKTLLFVTQRRGLGDENTPRINVFDKANGDLLGHIPLPEAPNGNPVTYLHEGRQYLVVAVGGGPFFGGYSDDAKEIDPGFAERLKLMSQFGTTTKPELIALRLP
jgi:quinoprotein glucose dehydrogenase